MEKEKLQRLLTLLYESREPALVKLASQLGDDKFKSGLRKPLLDKKMECLLEYLFDPQSNYYVKHANNKVRKLRKKILYNTGWYVSRSGATNFELATKTINAFIGRYSEIAIFHVDRDETGYHLQNIEVDEDSIYGYVREKEQTFLEQNQEALQEVHQAFTTLEQIMGGGYHVTRGHEDLAELVCEYFGYQKTQEVEKKK